MGKFSRLLFLIPFIFSACHTATGTKTTTNTQQSGSYRIGYDDSVMSNKIAPFMMPYNRIIQPVGYTAAFGDTRYENHSLDCKVIPNQKALVVEDRYGIAIFNTDTRDVITRWSFNDQKKYMGLMSTYSGIQVTQTGGRTNIYWSAANAGNHESYVMVANWDGEHIFIKKAILIKPEGESPLALPNELKVVEENGGEFLYVVLNGNNQLLKINLDNDKIIYKTVTGEAPYGLAVANGKAFITNWGGEIPTDTLHHETAGIPYGHVYTNPKTGATGQGTVSVIDTRTGAVTKEISVGLHPNAIVASPDKKFIYVANGNSDNVYVIDAFKLSVVDSINIKLDPSEKSYIGDTPNALAISSKGTTLYVANGMDNAIAIVQLGVNASSYGKDISMVKGFIPTEAYPGGVADDGKTLYVTNLEGEGARASSDKVRSEASAKATSKREAPDVEAYNAHHQEATVTFIVIPTGDVLKTYTEQVKKLNNLFRSDLSRLLPRRNVEAQPVPQRIGEPSVFKHVLYIIKENRTYDQVLGDMPQGNGSKQLCIYGDSVTPNQHQLAKDFILLDNYYASGKSSAEGHQWTDQGMVNDYVEKNVRAWFRSYPHVQTDALVYNKEGFIWNNALDHGKTVRIFGEACVPIVDKGMNWTKIYNQYLAGNPLSFTNYTTIARMRPILSPNFPGYDSHDINDQVRADGFIKELKDAENKPGDNLPQLMVMALPSDHTGGIRPGLPTPAAMIADNDLALGRIVEAVAKSRFWDSTVIFVTEDDSQDGWDHVSAYRTIGNVISKYSRLQRTVHTNYNQTSIVRTIEQILGIPPMTVTDATALPMFDCFNKTPAQFSYLHVPNKTPLNQMNKAMSALKGKGLYYAKVALRPEFNHIDGGNDDLMNRMLWYAAKGEKSYPGKKE